MKNFIVGLAIFLLLLIFPLQTSLETINEQRRSEFHNVVYVAAQEARQKGCFDKDKLEDELNNLLVESWGIDNGIYKIEVTEEEGNKKKYRKDFFDVDDDDDENNLIYYDIIISIGKKVATPKFLGITDKENMYFVQEKGFVLSELLE